jgi:putative glutamine amidotransferase
MSSILISCRNKTSAVHHYVPALKAAGWHGSIHLVAPGDPAPSLDGIAALLISGGGDIHPSLWDEAEPVHPTAEVDAERDAQEIPLVKAAWEQGIPILGICRGGQILNVALGGSLIQDVPEYFSCETSRHHHGSADTPDLHHSVAVTHGSRLASLLGTHKVRVNSRHHQAVNRLADPLRAVAFHPETLHQGIALVEGIEAKDPERWAVGVQWHPENLAILQDPAGDAARGLFQGFIQAAMDRHSVRVQESV